LAFSKNKKSTVSGIKKFWCRYFLKLFGGISRKLDASTWDADIQLG
jgi:hypothetical protein